MKKIKTFCDPRMNSTNNSFCPSSEKPGRAVADWLENDLCEICTFDPATRKATTYQLEFAMENTVQTKVTFRRFARGKNGESAASLRRKIKNAQQT